MSQSGQMAFPSSNLFDGQLHSGALILFPEQEEQWVAVPEQDAHLKLHIPQAAFEFPSS